MFGVSRLRIFLAWAPAYTLPTMRLSPQHQSVIRQAAHELVGDEARVLLFGSRTDDAQRGGDVDVLVQSPQILPERLALELRLGARLERALGGRKVDLLLVDPTTPLQSVHRIALAHGVPL
jgi:predicted nucleotidyltransferase